MELRHEFTVPTGIQQAWDHFQDIETVATCFPGAQVTSVEQESFSGQVKVKLGPIALVYTGSGQFIEKDEAARRFVVDAKGRDKRGNGTAGATVRLTMTEQGPESTVVEVRTDLTVTGKPAQFGRGVMQDVSDKLLGQFTDCLERQMRSGGDPGATGSPLGGEAPDTASESTPLAAAAAKASSSTSGADTPLLAAAATGGGPLLAAASAPPVSAGEPVGPPPPSTPGAGATASTSDEDPAALDLGATVLPVLARAYWKQALAVVLGLLVLRRLLKGSGDGPAEPD